MKKSVSLIVIVTLLGALLTACQRAPLTGSSSSESNAYESNAYESIAYKSIGDNSTLESSPSQTTSSVVFTDSTGRTFELSDPPERVAVLFSSFAEVWRDAGGETAITVGEAVERGFVPEGAVLVDSGAGKEIDREALIDADPDFVICSMDIAAQAETADFLNEHGINAAQFHVDSFEEYLSMLRTLTSITGRPENYATYGEDVALRVEAIKENTQKALEGQEPSILFIRAGSGANSTKAKTADDNFVCLMLKELGSHNIAEDAPVLLDGLSFEEILMKDPDIIFISTMGSEKAAREYMDDVMQAEGWQALTAVQNGRCYYLPKDMFQFKPNARWADAYEYLAKILEGEP